MTDDTLRANIVLLEYLYSPKKQSGKMVKIVVLISLMLILGFYLLMLPAYNKYKRLARSPISQNAYFLAFLLSPVAVLLRAMHGIGVVVMGVVLFAVVLAASLLLYPVFFFTEHLNLPSPITKWLKQWKLTNTQLFEQSYELFAKRFMQGR